MKTTITKEFVFDAAHHLPDVPDGHKCKRLHGHSYRLVIELTGTVDPELGWLIDFADIASAVEPVIERVDHYCLNDLGVDVLAVGFDRQKGRFLRENPTAENLALWFWLQLEHYFALGEGGNLLSRITIHESHTTSASVSA